MVQKFSWQYAIVKQLVTSSDADHAGCRRTRRSTSGGVAMLGSHVLSFWCKTQTVVSNSSGESEYYGILKAATEGLYLQHLLEELGDVKDLVIMTDSTAAKGFSQRLGVGSRMKHLETSDLWLQEKVHSKALSIGKVKGTVNVADIGTKNVDAATLNRLSELMAFFGVSS